LLRFQGYLSYHFYYTTAADLVARTSRAALEGRWQTTMRFWNGPQLLDQAAAFVAFREDLEATSSSAPLGSASQPSSTSAATRETPHRRSACSSDRCTEDRGLIAQRAEI